MSNTDIDKIKQSLVDAIEVYEDVKKAKESDDKITLMEGGILVLKHAGKAVRFVAAIPEIGKEAADIDSDEAVELTDVIVDEFAPGSPEAAEAVKKIVQGAGLIKEGIETLIELRKSV